MADKLICQLASAGTSKEFMQFNFFRSEIFSSLSATLKFIDEKKYRPMLFLEEEALEDFCGELS